MSMKKILLYIVFVVGVLSFVSCELDNYDGPNATFKGAFIDNVTGDTVQSDIIDGAKIQLIEMGYENPPTQFFTVKADGTFMDKMMFANTYVVLPIPNGNFVPQLEADTIQIEGVTTYNFDVQPYIRIKDASITVEGAKVTAKFKLERTTPSKVKEIGLYGHRSPSVGQRLQDGSEVDKFRGSAGLVSPDEEFTLILDLGRDKDFVSGESYFFRIGALSDTDQAKYNYVKPVRLEITKEEE